MEYSKQLLQEASKSDLIAMIDFSDRIAKQAIHSLKISPNDVEAQIILEQMGFVSKACYVQMHERIGKIFIF